MGDPLSDSSPLISAAMLGKLRLVRLLLEGGAQVNEHNPRGETPLLAACKALRGEPSGPGTLKLLQYLLQNQADPNAQDKSGRTPLMYACMERAGAQVASTLLSAGADPSMEDYSGASALVYAVNAKHQPTLQVLLDTCRARGRDIIIIATEMGVSGGPVTRRYLNVPPSPDTSPVSCMSPSDIVLKTGSPNSPEVENVFNFRGSGKRGSSSSRFPPCELHSMDQSGASLLRQRLCSEPWLAIHNLARLNTAYEEGRRERSMVEEGEAEKEVGEEDRETEEEKEKRKSLHHQCKEGRMESTAQSLYHNHNDSPSRAPRPTLSPTDEHPSLAVLSRLTLERRKTPGGLTSDGMTRKCSVDRLPPCPSPRWQGRRNTLPSLTTPPSLLHLPPLINQSVSDSYLLVPTPVLPVGGVRVVCQPQPHPPSPALSAPLRSAFLPPLPRTSSSSSFVPPLSLSSAAILSNWIRCKEEEERR